MSEEVAPTRHGNHRARIVAEIQMGDRSLVADVVESHLHAESVEQGRVVALAALTQWEHLLSRSFNTTVSFDLA